MNWDIIGMDACLMATLEVANTVKPFGKYMVASEETEPGHGWDYKVMVDFLGKNPAAASADIGRKIVDGFLDGNAVLLSSYTMARADYPHARTNGKTLSVIDLTKVDAIVTKLGALATPLTDHFSFSLQAFQEAQAFGNLYKNNVEYSVDIKHFAQKVKTLKPELGAEVDALVQAFDAAVVASRNDGTNPNANGLAIYTPTNQYSYNGYNSENFIGAPWKNYVASFNATATGDTSKPTLGAETDNGTSRSISFADDRGIKKATVVYVEATGDPNIYNVWGQREAPMSASTENNLGKTYEAAKWNGQWLTLCNGACNGSSELRVPAFFSYALDGGKSLYEAEALVRPAGTAANTASIAIVHLVLDAGGSVVDSWITLYTEENGEIVFAKEQYEIAEGLVLSFYYGEINVVADSVTYKSTADLTLTTTPTFAMKQVAANKANLYYFVFVEDAEGNSEGSSLFPAE